MPREYDEKTEDGVHFLAWACPYESRNGRECDRVHWVEWDQSFDSTPDGTNLYCPKHIDKVE